MPRQRIHDKPIIPAHILQLSFKVECDICHKQKKEIWKKYKKNVCWQCGNGFIAKMTSRPFKALCAIALLLFITGCALPREATLEARIAGQVVRCEVRK
jgi:hypothetical protein